ncbi:MAG: FAD binding domain-containing protein [Syntrophorhabdaceae bacterium]|nr:FAD binding domain-containing protein [Syntrophorhabdaceae bacterium]MDD4195561.1 FAD binding domain-containing protein [Syntrophorhabdaceae bacterium]
MVLPKFEYKKARDVADAIALYKGQKGKAVYLAGGTDLIPLIKQRLSTPSVVIDLKGIEELKSITNKDGWLEIGANVTLFELKIYPWIRDNLPAFYESLEATACETLQLRGTIGGNILQDTRCLKHNQSLEWRTSRGFCLKSNGKECNVVKGSKVCFANYCSDNAPALVTLGAELKLEGPKGERVIELTTLFTGDSLKPFSIDAGEILTYIRIPAKKTKGAYEKLRVRESMDYPLVGVAVSSVGVAAKICVGGVGLQPRLYELEDAGIETAIREIADKASSDAKPVANAVVSPAYRKKMVGVLVKRAVKRAIGEGK